MRSRADKNPSRDTPTLRPLEPRIRGHLDPPARLPRTRFDRRRVHDKRETRDLPAARRDVELDPPAGRARLVQLERRAVAPEAVRHDRGERDVERVARKVREADVRRPDRVEGAVKPSCEAARRAEAGDVRKDVLAVCGLACGVAERYRAVAGGGVHPFVMREV